MAREPKELTDDELNLKRKLRRRLIGAVALTLAVVVFLPMLLESQPKPNGQDIELRIPAPDKAGEFVPGVVTDAPLPSVEAASEVPPASEVAAVPEVEPAVTPMNPPPVTVPAVQAKAVEPPFVESAPKVRETPRAGGFAAQVGAYSSAATARKEADRVRKWGFSKVYTEQIGDKTRVRVGPYDSREQAEKVRGMLEKHGLRPVLVTLK